MNSIEDVLRKKTDDYRAKPFWSWNDKLDPDMLKDQIDEMNDKGLGGFMMHARGGLETEYMSEEWMECIEECIKKADKLGLEAWCYDEEGWPSGFAGGAVTALGFKNHMKFLNISKLTSNDMIDSELLLGVYCIEDGKALKVNEISSKGEYYSINIKTSPYYIDILSHDTVSDFIKITHEEYYNRFSEYFGKAMPGFFTDEPQYARENIPWTMEMPELFFKEYGYQIVDVLPALYFDINGCEKVRNDFWSLVSKLFRESFGKQIFDWCKAHNCKLTGHVMCEDSLMSQIASTAGAMSFYEYMDIPGIDMLGRDILSPIIPKQVGSASAQLGRNQVLTESFALCGWDVGFDELKWIAEWQFVNGVNLLCPHLESYTLRGSRKRDYPPSMFIQQPWWEKYNYFIDYFARLGALLGEGENQTSVMLLHPIKSAYVLQKGSGYCDEVIKCHNEFKRATLTLAELHIDHHYGDEVLMSKLGCVRGKKLIIGKCSYDTVVIPSIVNISETTFNLLCQFKNNGGRIFKLCDVNIGFIDGAHDERFSKLFSDVPYLLDEEKILKSIKTDDSVEIICDGRECRKIANTSRRFDDSMMYFFVNLDTDNGYRTTIKLKKSRPLYILNLSDMTKTALYTYTNGSKTEFELFFAPRQSYVIVEEYNQNQLSAMKDNTITIGEDFEVSDCDLNSLTLDICDYRIDGGEWVMNTPIIILQRILIESQKRADVELRMKFNVKCKTNHFSTMYLALESADKFSEININGNVINYKDIGFWRDSSFKKIDIKEFVHGGENEIILKRDFFQRQKVYDILFGKNVHESEINKLTLDVELESAYIVGDFSVYSESYYTDIERRAHITDGPFYIDKMPKKIKAGDFTKQGFSFFSGSILVSQSINISINASERYILKFDRPNAVYVDIFINDKFVKGVAWTPYEIDITDFVKDGENKLSFRLYSGNRNLLGPHHYIGGESYNVGTGTFTDRAGWSDSIKGNIWRDSYCFVQFGIK